MSQAPIRLAREGAIAQLILDRPDKRNALSLAMWQAIPALVGAGGGGPRDQGADPARRDRRGLLRRRRHRRVRRGPRLGRGRAPLPRRDRRGLRGPGRPREADHRAGPGRLLRRRLRARAVLRPALRRPLRPLLHPAGPPRPHLLARRDQAPGRSGRPRQGQGDADGRDRARRRRRAPPRPRHPPLPGRPSSRRGRSPSPATSAASRSSRSARSSRSSARS